MVSAIVLAGGSGNRMNSSTAKQYMELCGIPVVVHALKTFQLSELVDEIVLVIRKEDMEYAGAELVGKYGLTKVAQIIPGGKERFDSVWQGVQATAHFSFAPDGEEQNVILIHDGARPFVSERMIRDSVAAALKYGACTVAVPVKDTIKVVNREGFGIDTPDRSSLYQVQTPQTFRREVIVEAHEHFHAEPRPGITDDTMLVEEYLKKNIYIVEGDYRNLKITTPEDMILAEALLRSGG